MVHVQVVALITQSGDKVSMRAVPLDSTTIQSGGPKRENTLGKMVRKRSKPKAALHASGSASGTGGGSGSKSADSKKRMSLFRRISFRWAEQHLGSPSALMRPFNWVGRSFSFNDQQPKSPVSKGRSSLGAEVRGCDKNFDICSGGSESSTGSGSPPSLGRPSSFQGVRHKPKAQVQQSKSVGHAATTTSHLHKPVHIIQPSPLARTPSPSPLVLSPIRSPSPLTTGASSTSATPSLPLPPRLSNMAQTYSPVRSENVHTRHSVEHVTDSRISERSSSPDHLHPSTAERPPVRKCSASEKHSGDLCK